MVDSRGRAVYMGGLLILMALVHMAGCSSLGPRTLQRSHLDYNKAVQKAQMEEDLLNIVRLRYYDMPVSLSVSSISAQPSFSVGTSGEFGWVEGNSSANITPDINYTNRPTITFVPSQDVDAFARPVPLDTFVRLAASQARFDILLRVAVANLNGIRNHFNMASPEFDRMAAKFMELKLQNDLEAGFVYRPTPLSEPIPANSVDASAVLNAARDGFRFQPMKDGTYQLVGGESIPVLWVDPSDEGVQELLEELRLTKNETSYLLKNARQIEPPTQPSDTLAIRTRSLLEIAIYLSHGVGVPEAHREAGIARPDTGEVPNLSGLFHVRVSADEPKEPGIAVKYRNHWFYILDSDHDSKRTFGFVQAIFLSQLVEDTSQGAPVLTLPLN